jgi:hypothetical protein
MNKLTRRFKKKRKNKTFKGGSETQVNRPINVEPLKEGVHAVGNVVESVNNTVGDGVGWAKDTASEAVVGTTNFFTDKVNDIGNSVIGAIANKVLENMPVNISEEGVDIIEKKSEKIIEAQAKIAKKALSETTKILKEELPNIANAAGTATAAAFETIPFVGPLAAAGTVLNKTTEATEKGLDMVNQVQDVFADAVDTAQETLKEVNGDGDGALSNIPDVGALSKSAIGEASKKINNKVNNKINSLEKGVSDSVKSPIKITKGLKNLTKQKAQIGGRINDSIAAFTDPIGYQSSILKGGNNNKTKKSFIKNRKVKSRRVRFSF